MEEGVGRPSGKVGQLLRLIVLEEHLIDVVADVVLTGRQGKSLVDVDLRRVRAVKLEEDSNQRKQRGSFLVGERAKPEVFRLLQQGQGLVGMLAVPAERSGFLFGHHLI